MSGRRRHVVDVGFCEVVPLDEMEGVSEEVDQGMQFPQPAPARGDVFRGSPSGWGDPGLGAAQAGWGAPGPTWDAHFPPLGADSSRVAVDNWGNRSFGWETHSTWASAPVPAPVSDANWMTPDWSETSGGNKGRTKVGKSSGRSRGSVKDDRYIRYDGEPVIVERREEVDVWCDRIRDLGVTVLGFDTEWKPERIRGEDNTIALIQICYMDPIAQAHQVILFHTIQTGMTRKLKELLEDRSVIKAGVDLTCDKRKLKYHFEVSLDNGMDLAMEYSKIVNGGSAGGNRVGMKRLVNLVLGLDMKKPKSLQTMNWERPLGYAAIQYGALDAYVCSRVYEKLFES